MSDESSPDIKTIKHLAKMRCPKCGEILDQIDVYDIPIEKCPSCRGIWLDAGELELIAERGNTSGNWLSKLFKKLNSQ
jgi:Zn-finger nucleic acid-binding protein